MRRLEKINLIDRVGRELQSRMGYSDIDVYLTACGVDTDKETSNVNSKWIYVKELLADEPDGKIIEIADELEIDHDYSAARDVGAADTKFWLPGYFRLFLSHISQDKVKTSQLQKALRRYGVSGFVAHEDIEPTTEWQAEIEKALFSMDALAAILTPDFKRSNWTDQEVGVAIGRDVLVIPIRKGADPHGFIGKDQGYQAASRTVGEVAQAMFSILAANQRSKGRLGDVIVTLMLSSKTEPDVEQWLGLVKTFPAIPIRHLEQIQANALENEIIQNSESLLLEINALLRSNDLAELAQPTTRLDEFDDDIPF